MVSDALSRSDISAHVRELYDRFGWSEEDGVTHDARACEDLRANARDYVAACRLRVRDHLPARGARIMDMASGPIQYPEYMVYSEGYDKRVCVDLSSRALEMAKKKLGDKGEYLLGDFLDLDIPADSMDAVVSLHTIYHVAAAAQADVVRKLVHVTKPGGTVVIVYSNPQYFVTTFLAPLKKLYLRLANAKTEDADTIYFFRHPLGWWKQFEDIGEVRLLPWRSLGTREQKFLIPDNRFGRWIFSKLFQLEDKYPKFFLRWGLYPMAVIRKTA
jgi:SAM-dependent methyltransferase